MKHPLGRDLQQIRDEQVVNEATEKALAAQQTRTGGTSGTLSSGAAPQGAGLFDSEGNSLAGKLGFALGFSGLGGPDCLFPASHEIEVPERMFWEITDGGGLMPPPASEGEPSPPRPYRWELT